MEFIITITEENKKVKNLNFSLNLILLSFLIIFAFLMPISSYIANKTIKKTKVLLQKTFTQKTNRILVYSSIHPSIFKRISINNVRIYRKNEKIPQIKIDKLELQYNIFSLLFAFLKKDKSRFLSSIESTVLIEGGYINIDYQKDSDLKNLFAKKKTETKTKKINIDISKYIKELSKNFKFFFKDINISYKKEDAYNLNLKSINIYCFFKDEINQKSGNIENTLIFNLDTKIQSKTTNSAIGDLSSKINIAGKLFFENQLQMNASLNLNQIQIAKNKLNDLKFSFLILKDNLFLHKSALKDGLKLDLSYSLKEKELNLYSTANKLKISNFFKEKANAGKNDFLLDNSYLRFKLKNNYVFLETSLFSPIYKNTKIELKLNGNDKDTANSKISKLKKDLIDAFYLGKNFPKNIQPNGILKIKIYNAQKLNSNNEFAFTSIEENNFKISSRNTNYTKYKIKEFTSNIKYNSKKTIVKNTIEIDKKDKFLLNLAIDKKGINILFDTKDLSIKNFLNEVLKIKYPFKKHYKASLNLHANYDFKKDFQIRSGKLKIKENNKTMFSNEIHYANKNLYLKKIFLKEKNTIVKNGSLNFTNKKNYYNINLKLPIANHNLIIANGKYFIKEKTLNLISNNIITNIKLGKDKKLLFNVLIKRLNLKVLGKNSKLNTKILGYYKNKNNWKININYFNLSGISSLEKIINSKTSMFSFSNSLINPTGVILNEFSYSDDISKFNGNAELKFPKNKNPLTAIFNLKDNESKTEKIYGDFSLSKNKKITGNIDARNIDLSRFKALNDKYKGHADAIRLTISNTLSDPQIDLKMILSKIKNKKNKELAVKLHARYQKRILNLKNFLLKTAKAVIFTQNSTLNLENGEIYSSIGVKFNEKNINDMKVVLNADFLKEGKKFNKFKIDDLYDYLEANLNIQNIPLKETVYRNLNFKLHSKNGKINLRGAVNPKFKENTKMIEDIFFVQNKKMNNAITGYFSREKEFELHLSNLFILSLDAKGKIWNDKGENYIDTTIENINADVGYLVPIIDTLVYKNRKGEITEGKVRLTGKLEDPDFYGYLIAKNYSSFITHVLPSKISADYAYAIFNGKELYARNIKGKLDGKYKANVDLKLAFSKYIPYQITLKIKTLKNETAKIKENFNGVAVDADVDGNIAIDMILSPKNFGLSLQGEMNVIKGNINLNAKKETKNEPKAKKPTDYDIALKIKSNTGALKAKLPIITSYLKSPKGIELRYDGDFGLKGEVDIVDGQIYYGDYFSIKNGKVYLDEYGEKFDPELEFKSSLTTTNKRKKVVLKLVADRVPMSKLNTQMRLYSDELSQDELNLLTSKVLGLEINDEGFAVGVIKKASNALESSVTKPIEKFVKKTLKLDSFKVKTEVLGNLAGALIKENSNAKKDQDTNKQENTTDTPKTKNQLNNIGTYFDKTEISIGKFLGDSVLFEFNLGFQKNARGTGILGDLDLSTDFSMQWDSPFFLFTWLYSPKFNDIHNLSKNFLNQTSLSFSWDIFDFIEKKKKKKK